VHARKRPDDGHAARIDTAGTDLNKKSLKFHRKETIIDAPQLLMTTAATNAVAPESAFGAASTSSFAPLRDLVLLIEDHETIASLLTTVLARLGLRVLCCPTGEAARTEFGRHQEEIALVFADCRLPDADGRDVCAAIREEAPELPLLVCSGNARCAGLGPLPADGRTMFLPKPYRPAEVLKYVRMLLANAPFAAAGFCSLNRSE
jgi:CheY-like chemotaxis protein